MFLICTSLAGCFSDNNNTQKVSTSFGDVLLITGKEVSTLHDDYIKVEVRVDGTDFYTVFNEYNVRAVPDSFDSHFRELACGASVRVYKVFNHFVAVFDDCTVDFSANFGLQDYLDEKSYSSLSNYTYEAIRELCLSRKFEFIKQFAYIAEYNDDEPVLDIIVSWSKGEFSESDMQINEHYSTSEIEIWCRSFVES